MECEICVVVERSDHHCDDIDKLVLLSLGDQTTSNAPAADQLNSVRLRCWMGIFLCHCFKAADATA